jgi:hypothetical protein
MNSNLAIKRALDELEYAIIDLQLDFAARNLERALLELRYIPDQPRIPAGNPDGGQWTSYGGSAGRGRLHGGTQRVAQAMGRQQFSGVLIRQNYIRAKNVSECTYYDSRADYSFIVTRPGYYCPNGHLFY